MINASAGDAGVAVFNRKDPSLEAERDRETLRQRLSVEHIAEWWAATRKNGGESPPTGDEANFAIDATLRAEGVAAIALARKS